MCDIIRAYKIPCMTQYLAYAKYLYRYDRENGRKGDKLMQTQLKRGTLELCVLSLLCRGDRYGYELVNIISDCMQITEGTIYPLMKRLKDSGSIDSYIVESQNGPPRKYYKITDAGRLIEKDQEDEWRTFSSAIDKLLDGEEQRS